MESWEGNLEAKPCTNVFAGLYEFLSANKIEPKVSDLFFQMKFAWSENLEKLAPVENCPEIEGLPATPRRRAKSRK